MSVELRIKAKSLAAEARIIREEEKRLVGMASLADSLHATPKDERYKRIEGMLKTFRPDTEVTEELVNKYANRAIAARAKYRSLHNHRMYQVKHAARDTHLARMYLKGRKLSTVEQPEITRVRDGGQINRVISLVKKYGLTMEMANDTQRQLLEKSVCEWFDEAKPQNTKKKFRLRPNKGVQPAAS